MKALKRPIAALVVADALARYSPFFDDGIPTITAANSVGTSRRAYAMNADLIIGA